MSELHTFIFDGLPVRGVLVRLTDAWQEVLARRRQAGAYPQAVSELLGEMSAAAVLMQANLKFDGAVIVQIMGDGPVKLAVAEARANLGLRATAKVMGEVADASVAAVRLSDLVHVNRKGRCAITLDPSTRQPGQQPYQGVVPLEDAQHRPLESLSAVLEHYMRQSEQLDTRLVLAANDQVAAGLLIQRLPVKGEANLAGQAGADVQQDALGENEDYNRIAILTGSLKREELLTLDADTLLHRLFWQEPHTRFVPQVGEHGPHFSCTCSKERVASMLQSLGQAEVDAVLVERGHIEVGCDFCGAHYRFDAVDAAQLFLSPSRLQPSPETAEGVSSPPQTH
jgi:molecular chaperone Hsp33